MDLTLQKATELGVIMFRPVFTARTEVRLNEKKVVTRLAHWQKVVVSACEQSGRARIPEIARPVELMSWAERVTDTGRVMLVPGAKESLNSVLPGNNFELLAGPEGGLDEKEVAQLERLGVRPVSLGPRTLRTETAGPAAIAILQALAGDM